MATIKLHKWDVVEHLKTEEDMALYLEACLTMLRSLPRSWETLRAPRV